MDSDMTMLIAAASGRALAASARRAGYAPLVADFFGDQDTVAVADAHVRLDRADGRGMDGDALLDAFETLAKSRHPRGAVCGTGFEDRPDLLNKIAARWTLLGNSPETVRRVKDPVIFAALCRRCGIPHPDTSRRRPKNMNGWLAKRIGGAGGVHIRAACDDRTDTDDFYFQRRVNGAPISALLLADGRRALLLGFSTQWLAPSPHHPFRYGGAARPALLTPEAARAMADAVRRLMSAIPLVGLNSADFLVDGDAFHLLEVNPRPGATLDIFEPRGVSLFALHVAACEGTLPMVAPVYDGAAANAIVYAERDIAAMPALDWPDWTADRPVPGSAVKAEAPLCTVFAVASTTGQARDLVDRRAAAVRADLRERFS
jgi:predicted ATP-grasp superfamily ATP-dependent carboligase